MKSVMGRTDLLALALAALVAAYGIYLVALGPILTVVTPGGAATVVREPNPGGLILILGAALVWSGVRRGAERWAWIGAALVLAFGVLFVFGPGGIVIPVAVALIVALIARRLLGEQTRTAGRAEP